MDQISWIFTAYEISLQFGMKFHDAFPRWKFITTVPWFHLYELDWQFCTARNIECLSTQFPCTTTMPPPLYMPPEKIFVVAAKPVKKIIALFTKGKKCTLHPVPPVLYLPRVQYGLLDPNGRYTRRGHGKFAPFNFLMLGWSISRKFYPMK